MIAVVLLAVIYTLAQVGLQGVVSPAALQANSDNALVYAAQGLGGSGWAKVMALALALSVIATTGAGIVMGARIIYGMASHRTLPEFLASVPRRFATPAAASIVFGVIVIALAWVYLLATSVENAFNYVVDLTGLLFALFYILTALAGIAYFRRRIVRNVRDAITVGLLPLASAVFLAWMVTRSMMESPAPQNWSMLGVVVAGLVLMLVSRFVLRSPFYRIRLESAPAMEMAEERVGR
jgi:amino acid transporter